ncbi:MAG: hypothetical protein ACM3JH_16130 [Acidithiobacillales bacterium]
MRNRAGVVAGVMVLSATLHAQQAPQPPQPQQSPQTQGQPTGGQQARTKEPPIVVYRIDLVPTGFAFAMNEPTLEGDTYVFRSLPDKTLERVPKAKVKAITRKSTDYSKEVVYQIDLAPSGSFLAREEPVKKGRNYLIYTWKQGTLLSVSQADVRKITRLTGFPAFKAEMTELGVVVLEGDTAAPGFKSTGDSPGPGPASPQAPATNSGNWIYQGTPGASDAYAPGNATVASPGDTPMAPQPTRPPR